MELRHIRYFLAVADELNVTRAATRVGIGQPPLSLQIKDLEQEVGTQLFHRLSHGVELTEAGRAFYDLVADMPAQAQRAVFAAQRASRGETGSLRVGFTGSALFESPVPKIVRAYRGAYPDVHLTLHEADSGQLLKNLRNGTFDIVFIRCDGMGKEEGIETRILYDEPLVIVLPAQHKAAASPKVRLSELKDDVFVLFSASTGPLFDVVVAACRAEGFEPTVGQPALQFGAIVNLVAAECGISLVPGSGRRMKMEGIVFRDVAGEALSVKLAVAHRRGDASRPVRNFQALASKLET